MELSLYSWVALGVIGVGLGVAASGRWTAAGTLLLANILVFLLDLASPARWHPLGAGADVVAVGTHAVQAELALWAPALVRGEPWGYVQAFSSMFVHADIWHLLGNSLALGFFGIPFEHRCGPRRFVAIYLLTGLAAVGAELLFVSDLEVMMMGASGAIFGILGAFAMRYPRQVIPVPVPLPIMFIVRMPVIAGAAIYAAFQLFYAYYSYLTGPDGVAYFAHLGGLVAGIILAPALVPKDKTTNAGGRQRVDLTRFDAFARTPQSRTILEAMRKNHDEPAVFQAWLDRFIKSAQCPTCEAKVVPAAQGRLMCTAGHTFDVRMA